MCLNNIYCRGSLAGIIYSVIPIFQYYLLYSWGSLAGIIILMIIIYSYYLSHGTIPCRSRHEFLAMALFCRGRTWRVWPPYFGSHPATRNLARYRLPSPVLSPKYIEMYMYIYIYICKYIYIYTYISLSLSLSVSLSLSLYIFF